MLPNEIRFDSNGIGYIDISNESSPLIPIYFQRKDYNKRLLVERNRFYYIPSTVDYILKLNKDFEKNDFELYRIVSLLIEAQKDIMTTEFPIGYCVKDGNIIGQIIRNYPKAKSLKNICIYEDISSLQKYIYRDDDSLHNLFLVYLEILGELEILYENNIVYLDNNAGNFVFFDNNVKIIDFEVGYVHFFKSKFDLCILLKTYMSMIFRVNKYFGLNECFIDYISINSFAEAKEKVKKIENKFRKR